MDLELFFDYLIDDQNVLLYDLNTDTYVGLDDYDANINDGLSKDDAMDFCNNNDITELCSFECNYNKIIINIEM